jgi:hypothetical protein
MARLPAHGDGLAGARGFDHRVLADAEPHALAGFDEEVAEFAAAGEPDPAVERRQIAAEPAEVRRVGAQREGSAVKQGPLRIHHQSPLLCLAIIVSTLGTIQ